MNVEHKRPNSSEYAEYYHTYVSKVETTNIVDELQKSTALTLEILDNLDPTKWDYAYAEGKWTIKELMIHIIDAERIMAYRALRIARGDQSPLPGFDQNEYTPLVEPESRSTESILMEYKTLRASTIQLFLGFTNTMLERMGVASDSPCSTRALGFIIVGHENHHRQVLVERYI